MQHMFPQSLYGCCVHERGCGVVTGQLARCCLSCMNMKCTEKNESNVVAFASSAIYCCFLLNSFRFTYVFCLFVCLLFFFFHGNPNVFHRTGRHSELCHHFLLSTVPWNNIRWTFDLHVVLNILYHIVISPQYIKN